MSYSKLSPQPAPRASDAPPIAPGLWPFEVAVGLPDAKANVAIGCEIKWLDNNEGASFYAWARAIAANGETLLSPHGDEIVTEYRNTIHPAMLAQLTADVLRKEHVLLVLGEPATLVDQTGPDENGNPVTTKQPMLNLPTAVRANASIRHALSVSASAGDITNLASLL